MGVYEAVAKAEPELREQPCMHPRLVRLRQPIEVDGSPTKHVGKFGIACFPKQRDVVTDEGSNRLSPIELVALPYLQ